MTNNYYFAQTECDKLTEPPSLGRWMNRHTQKKIKLKNYWKKYTHTHVNWKAQIDFRYLKFFLLKFWTWIDVVKKDVEIKRQVFFKKQVKERIENKSQIHGSDKGTTDTLRCIRSIKFAHLLSHSGWNCNSSTQWKCKR